MISERIKKLREDKGISEKQLADAIGVTYNVVVDWECGRNIPDIEMIISLSNYFNTTTDYLLKGAEPITNTKIMSEKVLRIIATCINYIGFIIASRYLYPYDSSTRSISLIDKGMSKDLGIICLIIGTTLFIISIQKERKSKDIINFWMINIVAYAILISFVVDFIFSSYWVQISYLFVVVLTEIILAIKKNRI